MRVAYQQITRHHEQAAEREDRAAAAAACEESSRRHSHLAELHRGEAAKRDSIVAALKIAFGDQLV